MRGNENRQRESSTRRRQDHTRGRVNGRPCRGVYQYALLRTLPVKNRFTQDQLWDIQNAMLEVWLAVNQDYLDGFAPATPHDDDRPEEPRQGGREHEGDSRRTQKRKIYIRERHIRMHGVLQRTAKAVRKKNATGVLQRTPPRVLQRTLRTVLQRTAVGSTR